MIRNDAKWGQNITSLLYKVKDCFPTSVDLMGGIP